MITQQQREDIVLAAVNCEHQIDADCIRLYRDPTKAGSALSQMVDRVVAAIEQGAQPGADGWIAIPEGGMPPLGEPVLVWCKYGPHWGPMVDCWDEQHEAPVSFSSATIPVGPGWDSGAEFEHVTHWKPITAPVAAPQPQQEQSK
jgi:hypothetical protein